MSQQELNLILDKIRNTSWGNTTEEARQGFKDLFNSPPHPTATFEAVDANGVPADWILTPNSAQDRVILYLHGGGFVMGSRETYRRMASELAEAAAAKVLLIDYRLAPEHPYPAAIEDGVTAYQWLVNEYGLNATQIALAGDSAGGNLVLQILLSLRETQQALPCAAFVISPYVDLAATGETIQTKAEADIMVDAKLLETLPQMYLPNGNVQDPKVSPIYADLSKLPPLLIHVGTAEILLDDSLVLARRAALADVAVELKVFPGMIHAFHLFAAMLGEAQCAISEAGVFLKNHLQ